MRIGHIRLQAEMQQQRQQKQHLFRRPYIRLDARPCEWQLSALGT